MPTPTKPKKDRTKDEDGNRMDPFQEMLHVMEVEHLIRFRRRLEKVGRKQMVAILTEEIELREPRRR